MWLLMPYYTVGATRQYFIRKGGVTVDDYSNTRSEVFLGRPGARRVCRRIVYLDAGDGQCVK